MNKEFCSCEKMSNSSDDVDSLPSTILKTPELSESSTSSRASSEEITVVPTLDLETTEFLSLYEDIQWLKHRQKHVSTCIKSDIAKHDVAELTIDELNYILICVQELQTITETSDALQEFNVSELQLAGLLHDISLLDEDIDSIESDIVDVQDRLMELLHMQTRLSAKVIKKMEVIQNLRVEVLKIRLQLSEQSQSRIALIRSLRSERSRQETREQVRDFSKDSKVEKLEKKCQHHAMLLSALNQIIASLITGSTINWAARQDMTDLLISVSQPLDVQLRECIGGEVAA